MALVSVLGFVMISVIMYSGSTARLVRREPDTSSDIWEKYTCKKVYGDCARRLVDTAHILPSDVDGKLVFPDDYFNRVCGFFINGSVCYEVATDDPYIPCGSDFPPTDVIKNFGNLSIKFCRNTKALNTLVPCLSDRNFYFKFISIIANTGGAKGLNCDDAKEQVRKILRLFEERCDADVYTSLKTVLGDFGNDLPSLFLKREDPSCNIEVSNFTP